MMTDMKGMGSREEWIFDTAKYPLTKEESNGGRLEAWCSILRVMRLNLAGEVCLTKEEAEKSLLERLDDLYVTIGEFLAERQGRL